MAAWQELGANILQGLHRQRQGLEHARSSLRTADESISKAQSVLRKM